ncbi:MAG: hypothetical protein QM704_16780 [Anaeromyxobacteraceae bacterium]
MSSPRPPLPRVDAYLAGLPDGFASHPGCLAKGAVVRNAYEDVPDHAALADALPPELAPLVREPPLAGEWVPEVQLVALVHGVADVLGLDDAAAAARIRARNRVLFDSPTYRILMAVFSPATLVRFSGKRWNNFHRGSALDVSGVSDDGVRFTLSFPAALFDARVLALYAQAFAAALELSGARSPDVLVEEAGPTRCRYRAVWG